MRVLMLGALAVAVAFGVVIGLGLSIERDGRRLPDSFGVIAALGIVAISILVYSPGLQLARQAIAIQGRAI
jgi:hypothetical protein